MRARHSSVTNYIFQFVLALLIMTAGVALLLVNLGFWESGSLGAIWHLFYPAVFIAYGLRVTADSFLVMVKGRGFHADWLWGLTITAVGILLILGRFGLFEFTLGMVLRFWPVILVYAGLSLLFSQNVRSKPVTIHFEVDKGGEDSAKRHQSASSGITAESGRYRGPNWSVEPIHLNSAVVDYEFDFTWASIPEGETPITMSGWVGDLRILIPKDVAFTVNASAVAGDLHIGDQTRQGINPSIRYKTPGYDQAERRLSFDIHYRAVDLRIDRV